MSGRDLEDDEANELIRRWKEHGDRAALHALVVGHSKLLYSATYKVRGSLRVQDDALQEARLGFLRAVEKFDPTQGRFWNYAYTWAWSFVSRYVRHNHLVRVGGIGAQDDSAIRIAKATRQLLREGVQPTEWEISARSGLPLEKVFHVTGNATGRLYLDLYMVIGEDSHRLLVDNIADEDAPSLDETIPALRSFDERIENFMKLLDDRDLYIFDKRIWTQPSEMTLKEIGEKFGVSRERIRQLEAKLIRQLAGYFRDELIRLEVPGAEDITPWAPSKRSRCSAKTDE